MGKKQRIKDKIKLLHEYKDYLYEIFPKDIEIYKSDLTIKAACERYIEKIIECCVDICFLVAKEKNFEMPENEEDIFPTMAKNGIISENLAKNLKSAKGMRNVLAHKYGEIDDSKIFSSIDEELGKDLEEFLDKMEKSLEEWEKSEEELK